MGKLKRVPFQKKKSILVKGKHRFRTLEDAKAYKAEHKSVMGSFVPEDHHYELVELMAANNTPKKDVVEYFGICDNTFEKHFGQHFARGKIIKNMKTTKTLYDLANGTEGLYDYKKKKWIVRPRSPDVTSLIWWDKTRGGWREGTDVNVKGKGLAPTMNVVVYLPPNGREAGAGGDPTYILRKQAQKTIEGNTVTKNSR